MGNMARQSCCRISQAASGADRGADFAGHVKSDGERALALGEIHADPAIACGGDDAFADAEQNAKGDQLADGSGHCGAGRSQAPETEAEGVWPLYAVAVHHPPGQNLQDGVCPEEGGVEDSAIGVGELKAADEIFGDQGDGEIGAGGVGNDHSQAEESDHGPAASCGSIDSRYYGCAHYQYNFNPPCICRENWPGWRRRRRCCCSGWTAVRRTPRG